MPRRPPTENGRHHAGAKRVGGQSPPSLLRIPLEMREYIYSYLVDEEEADSLLDLLLVNRQIFKEARPFLFRRPLTFAGQSELFAWRRMVRLEDLHLVTDLSFQLQDIRPDEIVGALGRRLRQTDRSRPNGSEPQTARDNPYHEACEMEVRRIGEAFSMMPNVKRLTIFPCTEADPRPSPRMLVQFSKMLARCFPNLDTLWSREVALPIGFVANKPRLRDLQIPSTTSCSPSEVAGIFSNLHLRRLSLYGGVRPSSPSGASIPSRDIVAEVLRVLRPLRELTFYEASVEAVSTDIVHEALVKSPDAIGKHLRTLRTLKVLVEYTPSVPQAKSTIPQFRKFLQHSAIERLEVAEPLSFALGEEHLPSTLRTFVARLDRPCESNLSIRRRIDRVLPRLQYFAGDLEDEEGEKSTDLKDIVLVLEGDEDEAEICDIPEFDEAEEFFEETDVEFNWMLADGHESL